MNRKQRAMEERYKPKKGFVPAVTPYAGAKPIIDFENANSEVGYYLKYGPEYAKEAKKYLATHYANGAEMYERVMAVRNSPLMEALK